MSPRPSRAAPRGGEASSELAGLLSELMSLINRRSAGDALALMNAAGLTMGQMVALFVLDLTGAHTVGALAQKVHLSPAAASHMIDQLVRGKLVGRAEDPRDRRLKWLAITARGRAFIRRLDAERRLEVSAVVAQLAPRTAARLKAALREAVEALKLPGDRVCAGPRAGPGGR